MPINAKGILFMTDLQGSFGWTEVYYMTPTDITDGQTKLEQLASARRLVLPDQYIIQAGRISDEAVKGDSLLTTNTPLTGSIVTAAPSDVCQPWTALLSRDEAGAAHRGRHFFHGVMVRTFTTARIWNPGGTDATLWTTFGTYVQSHTVQRSKVGGVFVYNPITAVIFTRQTERKVGRPFDLLRGRRTT